MGVRVVLGAQWGDEGEFHSASDCFSMSVGILLFAKTFRKKEKGSWLIFLPKTRIWSQELKVVTTLDSELGSQFIVSTRVYRLSVPSVTQIRPGISTFCRLVS